MPEIDFQPAEEAIDFQPVDQPQGSRVVRAARNLAGGTVRTVGSMLEGAALAPTPREEGRNTLTGLFGIEDPGGKPSSRPGGLLYRAGTAVRQAGERIGEPAPEDAGTIDRFFTETLPNAAGSMAASIASAVALRRVGVRPTLGVAATGAAAGAGDGYLDAIRKGADEETAMFSALANAGLGATEAVPIAKWLTRVGGTRAFATALREGGEEGLQEFLQSVGGNLVAQGKYDPDRPWAEGAGEGAAAGVTLGTVGSLLVSAVARRRARARGTDRPASPKPEPDAEADLLFEDERQPQPMEGVTEAVAKANAPTDEGPSDFSPLTSAGTVTEEASLENKLAKATGEVAPATESEEAEVVAAAPPIDFQEIPSPAPALGAGLGAGAAAETQSVQEPPTAPAESPNLPAALTPLEASPTVPEAGPGPETITGSNERRGSEMPAEVGSIPAPIPVPAAPAAPAASQRRRSAPLDRPHDLLDEIEGNIGFIDPKLIREANPDWRPVGLARRLFRRGGEAADSAIAGLAASGVIKGDIPIDQFGDAINAAARGRQANRKAMAGERRQNEEQGRQLAQFTKKAIHGQRTKEEPAPVEVPVENLVVGDVFEVQGFKFQVTDVEFDEDGRALSVTVKDGPKFGVQMVNGAEVMRVDPGTFQPRPPVDDDFGFEPDEATPAMPPAQPEGFFDKPESIEEQKAREAREKAQREEKAAKDRIAELAAKPLIGTTGDLGQGGLFESPEDLFAPPPPKFSKPAESKPVPKPFGADNKLVTTEQADELKRRLRSKLGRVNIGVDPTIFSDAVQLGVYYLEGGVRAFPDWAARMIEDLGDGIRPLLRSVYEGARAFPGAQYEDDMDPPRRVKELAGQYAAGANPNLESTGGGATGAPGQPGGGDVRTAKPGEAGGGDESLGGAADSFGTGPAGGQLMRGDLPDPARPTGDPVVPSETGTGGTAPGASGTAGPRGSSRPDETRASIDSASDLGTPGVPKPAPDAASVDDSVPGGDEARAALQRAVEGKVEYRAADAANIAASLPFLFPAQQEDVLKTERRFAELPREPQGASGSLLGDPKRGILFTNGTGTGKTFTGLGVIKRFAMQGKGNVLVVVPSQSKVGDWISEARFLNLTLTALPDTNTAGQGIVVTTYANLRNNLALVKRDFDLVMMDECHHILSNEQGEFTAGIEAFRKHAHHPNAIQRKASDKVIGPPPQEADFSDRQAYHDAQHEYARRQRAAEAAILAETERLAKIDTRVVYLSATPFAYHKSLQLVDGYLYSLPKSEANYGYNVPKGFDRLLVENFGYRMRTGRLTEPDASVRVELMEMAFADQLTKSGAMSGRVIDVPADYSREFVVVDSEMASRLDDGWGLMRGMDGYSKYPTLARAFGKLWDYNNTAQFLEALKIDAGIPRIREHIAANRKVILFHTYIQGGIKAHPFRFQTYPFQARWPADENEAAEKELETFAREHPELVEMEMPSLERSLAKLESAFGKQAVFFNGTVPKRERAEAIVDFMRDGGVVRLFVSQLQAGKEGISLHDKTGQHPRVVMMAALPNRPTDAIQAEGRAYRIGVQSNAIYEYLALHTSMERFQFASRINEKVSTAETLAMGSLARNLRERFKDGYLNALAFPPGPQQGVGGKMADRRQETASDFERALTFYFGRMRKNSRTKSAEGIDYYATPEPLGLKMVEWGQPRPGSAMLEPSAGHGAIGRWFPPTAQQTFIEPSGELRSELAVKVEGGRVVAGNFEDLDIVNKYDVIVMNPPFGTGGAKAMQHLAKAAWQHLRDGGRIVALIPEGPAADKQWQKFAEHPLSKHIYLRRTYGLPTSVFERAGTSVKTKVVILDRSDAVPLDDSGRVDLVGDQDINAFFASIREKDSPARPSKPAPNPAPAVVNWADRGAIVPAMVPSAQQAPTPTPAPAPRLLEPAQTVHTKTRQPLFVARTMRRVSRDRYDRMAADAKRLGGYWSSYAKDGAIPGFQFPTKEARDTFLSQQNESTGVPPVYSMMLFPPVPPDPETQEVRQFMHQVAEEPTVSDLAKRRIANAIYNRRTNEEDAQMAARLIDQAGGPEPAISAWRDQTSGVPSMVRTLMGQAIIKRLGVAQQKAAAAGNGAEAERLADVQAQFVDEFAEAVTDTAQALQSLRMFASMTPEGFVSTYKRAIRKRQNEVRETVGPHIRTAVEELNAAGQDAVSDLQGDPDAQAATRQAIDQAIQESPKVREAIRVVVSRSFGDSATILEGVRKVVIDAFNRANRTPRAQTLWERYRKAAARAIAVLPGRPQPKAALDEFTRRVMTVLRAQVARVAPKVDGVTEKLPPLQQMLEAFANPEKYQEVWLDVIARLRAEYPTDPRVDVLASQPAALVSEAAMRQALKDELVKSDVSLGELIGNGYIVNDGRILSERIQSVLGWMGLEATPAQAQELATTADRQWRKIVAAEEKRVGERLGEARKREARALRAARSGLVAVENIPEAEIDALVRQQLKEARTNIAQVIRGHWRGQIAAGVALSDRLKTAGLPPQVAEALGQKIQERMANLVARRKREAIERIRDRVPRSARRREPWDRLIEASNLGALSDEDAWNALAPGFKLPTYSRATAARVVTLANEVQRAPEGFQRDRKVQALLDFIKTESGVTAGSLVWSLWYARLLSGPTTHVLNVVSNLEQLAAAYTLTAARRPGDAPALARALMDGFVKALPEMQEVLTKGRVTGVRMLKAEPAGALELAPGRGVWRLLRHWRMVGRLMAAEDMAVFFPIREMRQVAMARELARRQGLQGPELEAEVEALLGQRQDMLEEAQRLAEAEGLQGMDLRRRVNELVESRRSDAMRDDAMDYALRYTFNSKPYGFLGTVANHMRAVLGRYPAGRLVVPFVNVVANVANEAINYSPMVAPRLWDAYRNGRVAGRDAGYNEVFELYAKAAAGTILTSALAAVIVAGWDKDDDERKIDLSGPGPADADRRRQLMMTGWRPFSIKLGDRWVNYQETPFGVVLGGLGMYLDAVRYKRLDERGMAAKVLFGVRSMVQVLFDRSMLQGVADLVTWVEERGVKSDEAAVRSLVRPLGTMAFSRLGAQVDRMLDPTLPDSSTVDAAILSQVPFGRRLGRPALNVFGEPVQAGPLERFVSKVRADRLARVLAAKRAWIPMQTPAELGGGRGPFTAHERYRFIRERGPALRAHLELLLPRIEQLAPEQAQEFVSRVAEIHTARTKAKIVGERKR